MSLTSLNTAQSADEVLVHTMPTSATTKMKIGWILSVSIRSVIPTASIVVENGCLFYFLLPMGTFFSLQAQICSCFVSCDNNSLCSICYIEKKKKMLMKIIQWIFEEHLSAFYIHLQFIKKETWIYWFQIISEQG